MAMGQRGTLDVDSIVAAAFAQLEAKGLDGLSMRDVAAALGVRAPALYWHMPSKADLVGRMAAVIYKVARDGIPRCEDWRDWLFAFGMGLRQAFASHRDGARLCAGAKPVEPAPQVAAAIAEPLIALGLSQAESLRVQASVISLTLGWALFEENGPMHRFLGEMMDCSASYEAGLRALIRGYPISGNGLAG